VSDPVEAGFAPLVVGPYGGHGFVIAGGASRYRYVVTAAHCLRRWLPPAGFLADRWDCTWRNFIGPFGGPRRVWAQCVFVDPVTDIAVLGSPDNQALNEQADAYEALTEAAVVLEVGALPIKLCQLSPPVTIEGETYQSPPLPVISEHPGWLFSLPNRRWFGCTLSHNGRALGIKDAAEDIISGMSGSPILSAQGQVVGVLCNSLGDREGLMQASLAAHLPGWLQRELGLSAAP